MNSPDAGSGRIAALLDAACAAPHEQDFYGLLRALENALPGRPRLGSALRPADEPVRLGQDLGLNFAAAPISSCCAAEPERVSRLGVRFMGLFGPNGPMPLHLTEYAHDRLKHDGDRTLSAFADIFNHRMILLLYRAWAQARPALWLDRDDDARFDVFVGAMFGCGAQAWWKRDSVQDAAKRRHAGLLARSVRNPEGLRDILSDYLRLAVSIEPWIGHWMPVSAQDRSCLGARTPAAQLGGGAIVGAAVWDRQYKFRIRLGPLSWRDYQRFLPGEEGSIVVRDWVRQYVGFDMTWELVPVLRPKAVRRSRLNGRSRLGLTAWLAGGARKHSRDDLRYGPESHRIAPAAQARPGP